MTDLKIWKIVFEIRYPAAANLFDNRGRIAAKWQWTSDLTEWRISNNQVSIYNKSGTTFLNAGFKNTSVVMELPESHAHFSNQASQFSTWVLDLLEVKKIDRIGLRFIQLSKKQHFKLLVTKMREKLFALSEDDWNSLGGYPEDIGLPLTLVVGDNRANFTLGPMKSDQLANYFESKDVKGKLPSVALFLDFDLYRTEPNFSIETRSKEISDYLKAGSQQILDISDKFLSRYGGFK
ncbi:MAG: hypothetical protein JW963_06270 [Anaerolineales bacterium]|nr:hypothetical protein [Anaerolineales bacterium]